LFSPDGKVLASGHPDGLVQLWGLAPLEVRAKLPGHLSAARPLAFNPDGNVLVSHARRDGLKGGDLATNPLRHSLPGTRTYTFVDFSPDGKTLAACKWGREATLWDVATGQQKAHFYTGGAYVRFSPDGKTLVDYYDGLIILRDAASGKETAKLPRAGFFRC